MEIVKLEGISDGIVDSEFLEFFGGKVDNTIVGLIDEAFLTGDVVLLKVFKNTSTTLGASVRDNIVRISGHYEIDGAWSDKDDRIGVKQIKGLVDGDYETAIIEKTKTESIIVLIPSEIL